MTDREIVTAFLTLAACIGVIGVVQFAPLLALSFLFVGLAGWLAGLLFLGWLLLVVVEYIAGED